MAETGIEIRWGGSIYDTEQRDLLRPKIKSAIDMATDGLAEFGVEVTERKYAVIHAVDARLKYLADTSTKKTMNVYLSPGEASGRIDRGCLARTILHEALHWESPITTIGELAVSEGICYNADYIFGKHIKSWRSRGVPVVERVGALQQAKIATLYDALGDDFECSLDDTRAVKRWYRAMDRLPIRRVDIVGIAGIAGRIEAGDEIRGLLKQAAKEVFSYEPVETAA